MLTSAMSVSTGSVSICQWLLVRHLQAGTSHSIQFFLSTGDNDIALYLCCHIMMTYRFDSFHESDNTSL